jgi:hypothetical protein
MSMRRLLPLALLGVVAAACGGTNAATHARVGDRRSGRVVVVAPVLRLRGAAPVACHAILTSLPPAGCAGVRVAGCDFRAVPGLVRYGGGRWQTPLLRITGVWDGRELHVDGISRVRSGPLEPPLPGRCRARATPQALALVRRVAAGPFATIAMGPCGRTAWMLVPFADRGTVSAIHRRYGPTAVVTGWLAPLRRS